MNTVGTRQIKPVRVKAAAWNNVPSDQPNLERPCTTEALAAVDVRRVVGAAAIRRTEATADDVAETTATYDTAKAAFWTNWIR